MVRCLLQSLATLTLVFAALRLPAAAARPVSFQQDVMAVLSKAGSNSGPCHGNKNGKHANRGTGQ